MSDVAIIGAGAGGLSAAVELHRAGHDVILWNRSRATLEPILEAGGVYHEGVFGDGFLELEATADLSRALAGRDAALVCLPTLVHGEIAEAMAMATAQATGEGEPCPPVILNPGHTGGGLEFAERFRRAGGALPPVAELSTLTYVARKPAGDRVRTSGAVKSIRVAALPGGAVAMRLARALYPVAVPADNVLMTGLANVNTVLHPPGAVLAAAWVQATGGDFTFYRDAMTEAVAAVMERLDGERRAVAQALSVPLPGLLDEMESLGTVEPGAAAGGDYAAAISGGEANAKIRAPNSLEHRYYREDFAYGLAPMLEWARIAGVETPVAGALMELGRTMAPFERSRGSAEMGIAGFDRERLLAHVAQDGT